MRAAGAASKVPVTLATTAEDWYAAVQAAESVDETTKSSLAVLKERKPLYYQLAFKVRAPSCVPGPACPVPLLARARPLALALDPCPYPRPCALARCPCVQDFMEAQTEQERAALERKRRREGRYVPPLPARASTPTPVDALKLRRACARGQVRATRARCAEQAKAGRADVGGLVGGAASELVLGAVGLGRRPSAGTGTPSNPTRSAVQTADPLNVLQHWALRVGPLLQVYNRAVASWIAQRTADAATASAAASAAAATAAAASAASADASGESPLKRKSTETGDTGSADGSESKRSSKHKRSKRSRSRSRSRSRTRSESRDRHHKSKSHRSRSRDRHDDDDDRSKRHKVT